MTTRNWLMVGVLAVVSCSNAWAEPYFIGPTGGDWGTPANWSTSIVPTGNAVVDSGLTATITSGTFGQTGWAIIGGANSWGNPGGEGTVEQSGGSLWLGDCLYLGLNSGTQLGSYALSGTGSILSNLVSIGQDNGTGQFTLSDKGLIRSRNWLRVGYGSGGNGTMTQTGGRIQLNQDYLVGQDGGVGAATQSAGSVYAAGWTYVGINGGGNGSYTLSGTGTMNTGDLRVGQSATGTFDMSGNTFVYARGAVRVGTATSGFGALTQSAGTIWTGGDYGLGWDNDGNGYATQSGGSLVVGQAFYIGVNSTGTGFTGAGFTSTHAGEYTLSGSGTISTGYLRVGQNATGAFTQSGTSRVTVRRWDDNSANIGCWPSGGAGTATYTMSDNTVFEGNQLQLGRDPGSAGTFTMNNNAAMILDDWFLIARNGGTGTLNVHSAASVHAGWMSVGWEAGAGTLVQDGGHVHTNGDYRVGGNGAGTGTATQSAGSVYVGQALYVGLENSQGTYTLSGNATISTNYLRIGQSTAAASQFTQSGTSKIDVRLWSGEATMVGYSGPGTYTLSDKASFSGTNVSVGTNAGSTGTLNINDNVDFEVVDWMIVGRDGGTGTLNLNGGTLNLNSRGVNYNSRMHLGWGGGGTGYLHLNGGNLITSEISSSSGTGHVYFNGGKITVQPNIWGNAFMYNLASANVQSGGAKIDTNGNNTTISQALIEDPTSTGGGLNKYGLGKLTLSGANTYSGATTVNAGTLQATTPSALPGYAAAGQVTVNSGATLLVNTEGSGGLLGQFYSGHDHAVYTQTPPTWFASKGTPGAVQSTCAWGTTLDSGSSCAYFPPGFAGNTGQITAGWVGKFNALTAGAYTFATASDDGSALWIDGTMVVNNVYEQGVTERTGTVSLTAGLHDIWLGFDQGGGGLGFYVRYQPPGTTGLQYIPNSLLSMNTPISGWNAANIDSLLGAANFQSGSNFGIDTSNGDFTYASNITLVNVGLQKLGGGTLTLSGTNTYGGGTTISAGTLSIASDSNIGGPSAPITFSGGILQVTGTALTSLGSHPLNTATFNGGFDVADAGHTFTVSQNLLPGTAGSLTKRGLGTLALTGANKLAATTVNGGTLRVSGTGSLVNSGEVNVGRYAGIAGALNVQDTASVTSTGSLICIGREGGTGTMSISGGTATSQAWFGVGMWTGAVGTLTQTGGTVRANTDTLYVGYGGGQGTYTMSGGTITTPNLSVGRIGGNGTMTMNNGTINIGDQWRIGSENGATGVMNVNGGTVNGTSWVVVGWVGGSTGTLNIAGGEISFSNGGNARTHLGWDGGTGNLHLDGGNLRTTEISTSGGGIGNLYWNGGKITVQANPWGNAFLYNLATANVQAGGAVIDTNGINTRITQALTEDAGSTGGGLTKYGAGALTLSAANTYSGPTAVNGGSLRLDFSVAGTTSILNPVSALSLGGNGALELVGQSGGTNSQTFNGLTLKAGGAAVTATQNGAASLDATLGAITRNVGSTVNFTLPTAGAFATTAGSADTILTAGGVAYATVGGNDWAAKDASNANIVGLSTVLGGAGGYTPTTWDTLSGNADVSSGTDTTLAANTTITSLRHNLVDEARYIDLNANTLTTGGILVTNAVGAGSLSIYNGTLKGPAGKDLVVIQNGSQALTIGSLIADNGTATGLTKSGSGELVLTADNSYTGPTTLNGGRTVAQAAGAFGTSTVTVNDSGQAWLALSSVYSNNFRITGNGWSEAAGQLGAIRLSGAEIAGTVTLIGNSRVTTWGGDSGTISGAITGAYGLQKTGDGTLTLSGTSANTFTGDMTLLNNGVLVLDKTGGNAIGGNLVYGNDGASPFVKWNQDEQIADTGIISYGTAGGHMHLELLGHTETVAGLNGGSGFGVIENRQAESGVDASGTIIVNNAADYSFNGYARDNSGGSGAGVLNFVKKGPGVQSLAGGNISYTGATTINGGTLRLVDTPNFNSDVTVNSGALELYVGGSWTMNKSISGAGSLVKSGGGTVVLGVDNSYTGGTVLTAGSLAITDNAKIGGASTPITFNGGVLRVLGTTLTNLDSHAASVNWGSFDGGFDIADAANTFTVTQSMGMPGFGGLTKLGPGKLVLGGVNNFSWSNVNAGVLDLSGTGSLTTTGELNVGRYGGANATINLQNDAALRSTGSFIAIGRDGGTATLNVTGGTVWSQAWLGVGMWGAANGTVNQSGGTVGTNTDTVYVGYSASTGAYNLSGGLLKTPRVAVGQYGGSVGTMTQTGGRIESGGDYLVGWDGATGTATQSAGSVYAGAVLYVGVNGGGFGRYTLSGDGRISTDQFRVGQSAGGQFIQSGTSQVTTRNTGSEDGTTIGYWNNGSYTISENASFQGWLVNVGFGAGANGTLNVQGNASFTALSRLAVGRGGGSAGTLSQTGGYIQSNGDYIVGWQAGNGTATQSDGDAYVASVLYLGLDTNSAGSFALSGDSTIITNYLRIGQYGTGTLTQSGTSQIHARVWEDNATTIGGWSGGMGTYTISENATFQGNQMNVGRYSGSIKGTLNVSDNARVSLDDILAIGRETGIGVMNITGGSVIAQAWVGVGMWGGANGTVTQSGGLVSSVTDTVYVGYSGSTGTYNMSGGEIISPNLSVGREGGAGTMTVSGTAAITLSGSVFVGRNGGSTGTLTMTGGRIEAGGDFFAGWQTGKGIVNQSAGSVYAGGPLYVGVDAGSIGEYTLSGTGTIDANYFRIGQAGTGTLTQSGTSSVNIRLKFVDDSEDVGGWGGNGTYTISENATYSGCELNVGRYGGSVGTMTINDNARVSLASWIIFGRNSGTGTLNMNGGTLDLNSTGANYNSRMHLGWDGGTGNVYLNGGDVRTCEISTNSGVGNVYFNGGKITVQKNPWGNALIYNLATASVRSRGAIIDTNGLDARITQALIQDPGSTGGGVTKLGAGTLVLSGASNLTGTIQANSGTLVLTGVNSLTGPVQVNAATLMAQGTGTGAGTVTLASAGKLEVGRGLSGQFYNVHDHGVYTQTPPTWFESMGAPAASQNTIMWGTGLDSQPNCGAFPAGFAGNGGQFTAGWVGKFYAETEGTYQFLTGSDDASALWVDTTMVVDNGTWTEQGTTERSGAVYLLAGWHDMWMGYDQGGGGLNFYARYIAPGGSSWQVIPNSLLASTMETTLGGLAGSGAVSLLAGSTLTVGTDGTNTTFSGTIIGDGSLVKTGGGILTLSGSNDYSAGTTVESGTLAIASLHALPAGRSVTIGQGGTLVLSSGLSAAGAAGAAQATAAPVPEPGTIVLLGIAALCGLAVWRRKRA